MKDEPMDNANTSPHSPVQADYSTSTSSSSSLATEVSFAPYFAEPFSTRELYTLTPPLPSYHPLDVFTLRLPLLGEPPETLHPQLADLTPSKPIQTVSKPRDVPTDTDPLIADEKDRGQDEHVATHRCRRSGPSASISLSAFAQPEVVAAEGRKRKRWEVDIQDPGVSPPIPKRSRQPQAGTSASTSNSLPSPTPSSVQPKDGMPDAMQVEEGAEKAVQTIQSDSTSESTNRQEQPLTPRRPIPRDPVPQETYRSNRHSAVFVGTGIDFVVDSVEGIRLSDASEGNWAGFEGRDDRSLFEDHRHQIIIRLHVGYSVSKRRRLC